jgi:hypothetical protein
MLKKLRKKVKVKVNVRTTGERSAWAALVKNRFSNGPKFCLKRW